MTVCTTTVKIRRLMLADQSYSINPLHLANNKERIDGQLPLDSMQRLKGLLLDYSGKLHYKLYFAIDALGFCFIRSAISVSVTLECQRCLKPFVVDIRRQSLLGIVNNNAEVTTLASMYEPLLIEDSQLLLREFIEDELLLAIPLYPVHKPKACSAQKELERINAEARLRSFSMLASLKK